MGNKFLYRILLVTLFSVHFLYSQTGDVAVDTTKKVLTDTTHNSLSANIERLNQKIDSLSIAQNINANKVSSLEEIIDGLNKKLMIAYAIGGLGLLMSLISLGYASSRTRSLRERLYANSGTRDIEALEKKYLENKKRVGDSIEDLSIRYNTLNAEFSKFKDVLVNEVAVLSLKLDASSSLSKNIETTAKKQEAAYIKTAEKDIPGRPKTFLVEYYVDNGEIKFKETNSGTPFYMDQYDDRAELTVNEATYAPSNYSESIQKCFKVNGEMSGKYRNKLPALCSFDGNLNTWNLIQMGELDAL